MLSWPNSTAGLYSQPLMVVFE